ncbi:hypothetical protein Pmar_PMAR003974 [Perkinsus marinus ATCC 50983]|uniref:Uncharacterized protein n=1 Tax=Perkinsus marinus (strain ATCC 50983 / TXsc) TaxID=423536 RepID=C5L939_PERM5|nr:hypothetical protein Pmar_PMAR003974 [Perkinsus marinus ATCC 50983]EER06752.1 hypothetical protein Pmar_PMAR003974 [Perkinsus marinus ATCC 50983]|eukprot:XP_002774936.1 hypothetical protein Pmar_PMAR003974 [Perkinsus marinus ATCC 50983]
MLGSVRAALLIIGVAATLEEEGVIDDLGQDPWVVTPMLSGGQYRLPDGAVVDNAEIPPGDLELTLRELENQVDPTVLRGDAPLSRHEHADLCGRAFGHLFRENPGWETTRERVGSVINEIMSAIGKGGNQIGSCYSILGLILSTGVLVDGNTGEALISAEHIQRILVLVENLGGNTQPRHELPPAMRLYRKGAAMGCSLGALALISSYQLGYQNESASTVSLAAMRPPAVEAVLRGESVPVENDEETCMEIARMAYPIAEAVMGNIGWDRLRVLNDADARSLYLRPGKPAPDDDVSMYYSWLELLPHNQWSTLEGYLTQEQIDELTAFLSDEESIAAGVAGGVSSLDDMEEGPAEVHASLQQLRYNIVLEKLRPALETVASPEGTTTMDCADALERLLAVIKRYHRTLRILDGISHTHTSSDIRLLAALFGSEMGLKSGHVNAARLVEERGLPVEAVGWQVGVDAPSDVVNLGGLKDRCIQVVTRSIILRVNTVNGLQTVPDWCRKLLSETYRMRAALGSYDAYSVRALISKYRGSDEEGADEIAYKWATYGADVLGDYQCMYELAMMDVFNYKDYPLALERLENLSKRPPVVFPWEVNPLDQFADPELEARVMDMLLENNPWTADSIGKSPDEEELQGMEKGGSAVVPAPHVTASVVGVGVAFLAYVMDCCRCGMYALSASRDHRFIGAVFQFECPFIKIPRGWPEPPTVQLTVLVLVLVLLLILLKILSGKLIGMLSRGEVPEHQHRE